MFALYLSISRSLAKDISRSTICQMSSAQGCPMVCPLSPSPHLPIHPHPRSGGKEAPFFRPRLHFANCQTIEADLTSFVHCLLLARIPRGAPLMDSPCLLWLFRGLLGADLFIGLLKKTAFCQTVISILLTSSHKADLEGGMYAWQGAVPSVWMPLAPFLLFRLRC